mmetsp:Transcript_88141/g.128850  ORF Transcript_88141/g.128850 Transcript_88141/m.128850 type:complete len:122 (-) Transcript_88141:2066-2431(-)
MQETLTDTNLAEYGMIPARLRTDFELVKWVSYGIALCVSIRVYRDGLSPVDALAAVINSGGLRAEYCGVPDVGQGGDLSHGMCDYEHVNHKVFGNHCLTFEKSYLAIARPLNFGTMCWFSC